jgi:hypothetical protein
VIPQRVGLYSSSSRPNGLALNDDGNDNDNDMIYIYTCTYPTEPSSLSPMVPRSYRLGWLQS